MSYAQTSLEAVSATRTEVRLRWNPSADSAITGYRIERQTGGGEFVALIDVTVPTAVDRALDPYETYSYRALALRGQEKSAPSNVITVGPPPKGFNVPVPLGEFADSKYFGDSVRMAFDSNGDPALAYLRDDQLGANDGKETKVYFVSWNRTRYQWNPTVPVGNAGPLHSSHATPAISLARDASTNRWAIAHETATSAEQRIDIHFSSDNGVTWQARTLAAGAWDSSRLPSAPSIGLSNGSAHVAWHVTNEGIRYATGKLDAPSAFAESLVPLLQGARSALPVLHLALDGNGAPAIVFVQDDADDYNRQIGYWRPSAGGTTKAFDSKGFQIDDPAVFLAFAGNEPRVLAAIRRDNEYYSRYDRGIWLSAFSNGGWTEPVNMPADGSRSMDPGIGLAIGPAGQAAVVTESNGGSGEQVQCSVPKLIRSGDLRTWRPCSVAPLGETEPLIAYPSVLFMDNGKLYVAFQQRTTGSGFPEPGVVLWREP